MALSEKEATKLLESVLAIAKTTAAGAEILTSVDAGRDANTRFARNEITSTGDVEETTVSVHVAYGKRSAGTSTNQTDPESLRALVERASRLAKLSPEDPERMPVLGAQRYRRSPSAYDAATDKLSAKARAAAAKETIALADAAKLQVAGFYEHGSSAWAMASSAGLRAYHLATRVGFTTTARTGDGTGSGWAGAIGNRADEIVTGSAAKIAIEKAVRSAKPRKLEPGRYTVVMEPAAVSELLSFLTDSLDARDADEGRSFFSKPGGGTRVGEKLFGDAITVASDPTSADTPSAPFDDEGFPLSPTTWIDKGVLEAMTYSRHWAFKQGKAPTGNPSVFHMTGGTAPSSQELVAGVKKGVLISRFWYTRWVDPQTILITGLTRDGTFLIEDGQVTAPVNNFRFNESPVTMLKNLDAMTNTTIRMPGGMRVPGLRTHEFHLASISEAV